KSLYSTLKELVLAPMLLENLRYLSLLSSSTIVLWGAHTGEILQNSTPRGAESFKPAAKGIPLRLPTAILIYIKGQEETCRVCGPDLRLFLVGEHQVEISDFTEAL